MHQVGIVTVAAENGIGGAADLLRLSPDRFPTSFAQPLGGDADAAKGLRADDSGVR
jgi:hypothetical protein